MSTATFVKPKLRGVSHEIAFYVSLVAGPILIYLAQPAARTRTAIYCITLSLMFGASAIYHRPNWQPKIRLMFKRIDHSMIFLFIAGTFTAIAYATEDNPWSNRLLGLMWVAAFIGIAISLLPWHPPKWVTIIPYIAMGWLGTLIMPDLYSKEGFYPLLWLGLGGLLYTVGAIFYASHKPNIRPNTFGYHEMFHAFVIGAATLQYVAVMMMVTR